MTDSFANRVTRWDTPEKIRMTEMFVIELLRNVMLKNEGKAFEIGTGTGLVADSA
jgi:methylase of polypeptide subunit release factors